MMDTAIAKDPAFIAILEEIGNRFGDELTIAASEYLARHGPGWRCHFGIEINPVITFEGEPV